MALTAKNVQKLVKKIKADFPMTSTAARKAIDNAWMLLATADVADWRWISVSRAGETALMVTDGGRFIAHLHFDDGILPPSDMQIANDLLDAFSAAERDEPAPMNTTTTDPGQVLSARLFPGAENCVEVTVQIVGENPRTMVMLPFLTEGEDLLAYAKEQIGVPARLIWQCQAFCMEQVPFAVPCTMPVLEMIIPTSMCRRVAA